MSYKVNHFNFTPTGVKHPLSPPLGSHMSQDVRCVSGTSAGVPPLRGHQTIVRVEGVKGVG